MSQSLFTKFKGSFPALPTPFMHDNNALDQKAYKNLIEYHIKNGSHGLVSTGTTGESPTLSFEEHFKIIELTVDINQKKLPIIAGTGANSTQEAIEVTQKAQKLGVDAALIVAPYYNKPTQEGMYQHFKKIHDTTDIPIILYNVPGRTSSDILPETVARLNELPRIMGIKDATGDVERISFTRQLCGSEFIIFSGEDGSALGAAAHGAHGCISVTANIAPQLCAEFQNSLLKHDFEQARKIQDKLYPLHQILFKEPNPVVIKTALSLLGIMSDTVRLPLIPTSADIKQKLIHILEQIGLL